MANYANYYDEWRASQHRCDRCGWVGEGSALASGDILDALTEFDCPHCGESLLRVRHPTIEESRNHWEKLDDIERQHLRVLERLRAQFRREKLKSSVDLPDVSVTDFSLSWDFGEDEALGSRTVIKLGDRVLFSEPAVYEGYGRFAEVAQILKTRYGGPLKDVVPTERSYLYLYGDRLNAPEFVDRVRRELFSQPSA